MKARVLLPGFRLEDCLNLPDNLRGNDLQAELAQVETNEVLPLLGEALFVRLIKQVDNPPLKGKWAEFYRLLTFWMAHLALKTALPMYQLKDKNANNLKSMELSIGLKAQKFERQLKRFLQAEKQDFSDWKPTRFDGGILNL